MSTIVKKSQISRRLIISIILFSSMITLFITLVQLYFEYKNNINFLNENIENVQTGYRQGITNAVWLDDKKQLTAILDGIYALPDIEYIEVRVDSELYAFSGHRVTENVINDSFSLQYQYDDRQLIIGETFIEANLSGIYQDLIQRAWFLLGSNAVKTFFVAIFMYILFDRLVFRRLKYIFNFVQQHDINNLNQRIDSNKINNKKNPDEISELASSLNEMQEHLSLSVKELLRLKTTLDLSVDGVVMFHPDNHKFFYANTGIANLLGYSVDELMNMTPIDICPDFNEVYFTRLVEQTNTDNKHASKFETIFSDKNGRLIPVRLILQYIDPKNEEPRFVFIARDITEYKKNEIILLQSLEDAKSASEAKSKFLMSISHELRTPLNAILGFSQLLEFDSDTLTQDQNESVKDILQGGRHLLKLIEDILDLSKIESDKIILNIELMDPVSLVNECIKTVSPMAVMKNVQLKNKIITASLPEINIDQTRFKQVLINLLTNAIKYNDTGGSVTLACELLHNNVMRFKVSDTGYGIKKSDQINVFAPFNRLGHEAGLIEGTGIGLSITKRLVELMDGEINFESRPGEGSDFWIDFSYQYQMDRKSAATETA